MKKVLFTTMTFVLAFVTVTMDSCKKGENDPFLSFHSRKGRMVGEWKLSAGTETTTSGSSTTTTTYTDTQKTQASGSSSVTTTYAEALTIEKDGSFKWVQTETVGSVASVDTYEGTWNFTGRVGELKNKEQVVLTVTKITSVVGTSAAVSNSYTGSDCPQAIWLLDQLKNKEMIIKLDGTNTDSSGTDTTTGTMTYVQ